MSSESTRQHLYTGPCPACTENMGAIVECQENERARIQQIVDKYRTGHSVELMRTITRDFIIWLAKENISLCDREDLITMSEAFKLIEEYCND